MLKTIVTVTLTHDKNILMQLRDDKPNVLEPGLWSVPSGRVKKGESFINAIKREFYEETGYHLNNPKLEYSDIRTENYQKVNNYHFSEKYDGKQKIKCYEGQKMEFIPINKISDMKMISLVAFQILKRLGHVK